MLPLWASAAMGDEALDPLEKAKMGKHSVLFKNELMSGNCP